MSQIFKILFQTGDINSFVLLGVFLAGAQLEIFQGRGGFMELGHVNKLFVKYTRKKTPQGNILELFLLDTLKTIF